MRRGTSTEYLCSFREIYLPLSISFRRRRLNVYPEYPDIQVQSYFVSIRFVMIRGLGENGKTIERR